MIEKSPFGFYDGQVILKLAQNYPSILEVIFENIQNAMDAEASDITVLLNNKSRRIRITDNGAGVSKAKFDDALTQIGMTMKGTGKLGQFGIGLISPFGKCKRYTFTSCTVGSPAYREWEFRCKELVGQKTIDSFPSHIRHELRFSKKLSENSEKAKKKDPNAIFVPWRTCVDIEDFVADQVISRVTMEELEQGIQEKYGVVMRQQKTRVSVNIVHKDGNIEEKEIRVRDFEGDSLPLKEYHDPHVGRVLFRIFIAPQTIKGRRGKVLFGQFGDPHRLNTRQFVMGTTGLLDGKIDSAFLSGIFEGEILGEKIELRPDRRGFVRNEALLNLCVFIEQWFKEIGSEYLEEIRQDERFERYDLLGHKVMPMIREMFKQPKFKHLLSEFEIGHIGTGHTPADRILGTIEGKSIDGRAEKSKEKFSSQERNTPNKEKERHKPFVIMHVGGNKRWLVKDSSTGPLLAYSEMPGSGDPYRFDKKYGLVEVNVRHNLFVDCDSKNDTALRRYLEHVLMQAFLLQAQREEQQESYKRIMYDELEMIVFDILHGSPSVGSSRGRKSKVSS